MQARAHVEEGHKITGSVSTSQGPGCQQETVVEISNRQAGILVWNSGEDGGELEMETWEPPVFTLEFKY